MLVTFIVVSLNGFLCVCFLYILDILSYFLLLVTFYEINVPLFPIITQQFPCSLKVILRYPLFPKTPGRPSFIPFPLDFISQRQQRWRSRLIHSAVLLSTRSTCVFQLSNFPLTLKSSQLNLLLCLTCLHWLSTQNSQTFPQINSCHFTKKAQ